jgi:hypothetical protein
MISTRHSLLFKLVKLHKILLLGTLGNEETDKGRVEIHISYDAKLRVYMMYIKHMYP